MDTMPITNRCPKCAAELPADAPQGLCAKCLLAAVSTPNEAGSTSDTRPQPPSIEAVAAAFPQLELVEMIGQGGMGFVFKARQPKLERFVALKVLPHKLGTDPAFVERFNREGRLLARLSHPNIVAVFDFGQAGEFFFLMMEYVDGVNLRQAMETGRFTPAQALALVPKICEALQFAHDEGILHRDIKPENILLDTRGRVKIADFGIAKLLGDKAPEANLTASGSAIGTPHYMAPEQLEHPQDVDQRADIYSLGVVFYEMLTGELPIGRFAPPSEKTHVDPRVDQVVFDALAREREKRIGSAREVQTRVETIAQGPTGGAADMSGTAAPIRLKPSIKPIVLVALVVAMVGLLINTVGPATDMIGRVVGLLTSSVAGALGASLAVASFGALLWLTNRCRDRILAPIGLGPVSAAERQVGGDAADMDVRLHKIGTITLITLAVFLGTRLFHLVVSASTWLFRLGWVGYALLGLGGVAVLLTRRFWQPQLANLSSQMFSRTPVPPATVPPAVPPLLATGQKKPVWPIVVGLLLALVMLPALLLSTRFLLSPKKTVNIKFPATASHQKHSSSTEGVIQAVRISELTRLPGLTVFQWKCTVPANHALTIQLVQWSSNGTPTVLADMSGYVVATANKPAEATLKWSLQDGARLSPDLHGQYRWDRSVVCGSSGVDGPPVWMPKEKPDWDKVVQGDGQKTKLRPLQTVPLQMLIRRGQGVDSRAVEAQVTLEPLTGSAPDKSPRFGFGTNWLDALPHPATSVAENPETTRAER